MDLQMLMMITQEALTFVS
jgi:hypothetical protein